jgi:uncharacterized membrane protein YozB (DUF420 family)
MNNKSILMPHSCQKIGWCLFLLLILEFISKRILFSTGYYSIELARTMAHIEHITLIISLFFICLSKEKVEDEMISSLRLRALGLTAYVVFLLFLVISIFLEYQSDYRLGTGEGFPYLCEFLLLVLPILLSGLYYPLFKLMLWRSRKEETL